MSPLENVVRPSEHAWTLIKSSGANLLSTPPIACPLPFLRLCSGARPETLLKVRSPPTSIKLSTGSTLQEAFLDSGLQQVSGTLNFHTALTQETATTLPTILRTKPGPT